ncbi:MULTISPECIES: hypothetical protein [unclassified Streptomyces]|uniref:hypothetical protein n=1 Tax=unclassified Streptomyces TaxID=2593676 RepID=UPI0033A5BDF0
MSGARRLLNVNYRTTVATVALPLPTKEAADGPVRRVVGNARGAERRTLTALPGAR